LPSKDRVSATRTSDPDHGIVSHAICNSVSLDKRQSPFLLISKSENTVLVAMRFRSRTLGNKPKFSCGAVSQVSAICAA
jgi:hypothetical protein